MGTETGATDTESLSGQAAPLHICVLSRAVVQHQISGGMEVHAEMLRRGLAERGHRVTTITTPHPRGEPRLRDAWGETLFVGTGAPGAYTREWWRESLNTMRQVHAHDPIDVVAGHGKAAYHYLGARAHLPGAERIPTVIITQNTIIHDFRSQLGLIRRRPHKVARWLPRGAGFFLDDRRRMPLADAITALTADHARAMQRWFSLDSNRLAVIPNGVDTTAMMAAESRRGAVRQRLGVGDDVSVVLALARLSPEKGQHYLLEALARPEMQAYKHTILVALAGDGPTRSSLIAMAKALGLQDSVMFLGRVPHDEVPGLLAAADLIALPSVVEGMPISLLEAMSCGLPVVASNIPAIASFIEDGVTGRLVPVAQPAALAQAIRDLLTNRAFAAELGVRARAYALSHVDQKAVIGQYERLFLRVAHARAES